jgi:hypothetical protein
MKKPHMNVIMDAPRPLYFRRDRAQQIVDLFAKARKPRLMDLLKLKIRHVYETTPGNASSKIVIDGNEILFKSVRSAQPHRKGSTDLS